MNRGAAMWKRKWLLIGLVLLALMVGVGFWIAPALREPEHGVTREVVGRIQVGMTADQVEGIIGMPPGGYRPDRLTWPGRLKHNPPSVLQNNNQKVIVHETMFWILENGWVEVRLDAAARVVDIEAHFYTTWQRIRMRFWRTMESAGWRDW